MSKKIKKNKGKKDVDVDEGLIKPSYYDVNDGDLLYFIYKTWGVKAFTSVVFFNVVKYNIRWDKKNGLEDLMKANKYISRYVEIMGEHNERKERKKE